MHPAFRKYMIVMIAVAAIYFVPVTLVNFLVDPMAQFRGISLDALDGYRQYGSRTAKAALIRQGDVDVAILGSSRPLAGLEPTHPAFDGLQAYNLALPGTNIFEQWDLFQYLLEHNDPKHIVLCIDFGFFDGDPGGFDDFEKSTLNPKQSITESWAESLWSIYALEKSWSVLSAYKAGGPPGYSPLGLRLSHSSTPWEERFRLVLRQAARVSYLFPPPASYDPERIGLIREMVDAANARGTEVSVVIFPQHASLLALTHVAGQWAMMEQWERDVVTSLAGTDAPVWDFTGFTERHTEPVPPDDGEMEWFTDPSHCSTKYGDLILRTVFETPLDTAGEPVAVRVTPENIESHLADLARQRDAYFEHASPDLDAVAQIRDEVIAECQQRGWTPRKG